MVPYHVYKLIHLLGAFLLVMSLGGQALRPVSARRSKFLTVGHGLGLLLLFAAGFGLLARLGIGWPWPMWTFLKIGVWVLLGMAPVLLRRQFLPERVQWCSILVLAGTAAYLATFKPAI